MGGNYSVDRLRESMVKILGYNETRVAGSGFIIKGDGHTAHMVTCHHVIFPLERLRVEYDGNIYSAEWCEEYSNRNKDIAILKINAENARPLPIFIPQEFSGKFIVYGFPQSREDSFRFGYDVSAGDIEPSASVNTLSTYTIKETDFRNPWNKLPNPDASFQAHRINTKLDPGTSGGPVFSEELGGVVGVAQSCYEKEGKSYAIRWDNIRAILGDLGLDPQKNAVCEFLEKIEEWDEFKYMKLFHTQRKVVMEDQYIPIQVTLERKYYHQVETWGYEESEEEVKRIYSFKPEGEESRIAQVPWDEAREKHKRIMVLADPGMGKSTLLRMEARLTARAEREKLKYNKADIDEAIFPIFLKLSELASTKDEIADVIPELARRDYPRIPEWVIELLKDKIKDGKCLLLLDALDEVSREGRNGPGGEAEALHQQLPMPYHLHIADLGLFRWLPG